MSVEIEKICRTCLALSGPLLSIYDGGTYGDTIADMLRDFTKMKPCPSDNMPQKVCLVCISEINRCYSFKIKCENSNRTLRQLLPDAKPEELDGSQNSKKDLNISVITRSVQTTPDREVVKNSVQVQTSPAVDYWPESLGSKANAQENLSVVIKDTIPFLEKLSETSNLDLNLGETPAKPSKRRSITTLTTRNAKKVFEEKITESYNIDCDENGYEFILKVEPNTNKDAEDEINNDNVLNKPVGNAEAFKITQGNSDCEEYEIEAVVEDEDQTTQSDNDDVVFVKTTPTESDDNSQKNFVIVKNNDEYQSNIENKRIQTSIRKEYGCIECVMTFYSLKVLRRHMSKLHGLDVEKIELNDMKYRIINRNNSNEKSETQKEDIAADTLTIVEEEFDNITSEPNTEPKNSQLKFICVKCQSSFTSLRSLNYHKRRNICNAKSYNCDQCDRVFTAPDKLESHKATHNNAAINCLECGQIFMTTEELSNHQINVHKRNARNQCNICKKVFTMLSTLRDHLRTHSGEKPFLCTICGKSFTQSANLKQHIQRHDKDKKFKCDECPNSYVTKAELFSHKRRHNGDHPYKCEDCSATFTTSSSLVKHRRRHTGERPYACDICPMRFAVLNVLKNHRRLHTGEKPYKCPHCNKRFTQRGDCMIHANKHVVNNMYTCTCGKSFAQAALLRQHSIRSHPELYTDSEDGNLKNSEEDNYTTYGEVDTETHIEQDETEDVIELNLAKICGQTGGP